MILKESPQPGWRLPPEQDISVQSVLHWRNPLSPFQPGLSAYGLLFFENVRIRDRYTLPLSGYISCIYLLLELYLHLTFLPLFIFFM